MIVSPSPKTNPFRTGLEMNSDTGPNLGTPPAMNTRPAIRVAAETSIAYLAESPAAMGATKAASIAAEDEVGVTASCRDVPKIAYTNMPNIAAYKPICG